MFPIMEERYGHDSPHQKSCGEWMTRFGNSLLKLWMQPRNYRDSGISEVKERFEAFAQEFEGYDLQGRIDPLDDFAGGF